MAQDAGDGVGVFGAGLFDFLDELEANNDREWFGANRHRYESEVREPAFELIRAARPGLTAISGAMTARDTKVGGSLMRVHRDVRFSADKSPYKTNVGIQFRHLSAADVHAPGYYVHLSLDECFFGAGSWMPDSTALAAYRTAVSERSQDWLEVRELCEADGWRLSGASLKRPPKGWPADHPMIDDLKRKSFIAIHEFHPDAALAADFAERVVAWCRHAGPLMAFLCQAVNLDF